MKIEIYKGSQFIYSYEGERPGLIPHLEDILERIRFDMRKHIKNAIITNKSVRINLEIK